MRKEMIRNAGQLICFLPAFCVFLLGNASISFAQGQCDAGPTTTETVTKGPSWSDGIEIVVSSESISRTFSIDAWVVSGFGCPPYQWSLDGTGFHFESIRGPTTATTYADIEIIEIWADASACGTLIIEVLDQCNPSAEREVRCTTGGYTTLLERCGAMDGWHQTTCDEGGYRYVVDHFNCSNPEVGDHGDPCPDHPCCGCSSYYCAEGSEKWGWGCP
jgi:hypothetical protein